jgi:SAM-dependent MidA family methyltransferase
MPAATAIHSDNLSENSRDGIMQRVPLAERLRARIKRDGPISFYDWMQAALFDEREGYYCRDDLSRWGRLGDYRTAPERTPLFAATFARYFAKLFAELGAPSSWTIIEIGAGFGEFAAGVLSNLRSYHPGVFAATHYLIDEVSADARQQAEANLSGFEDFVEFRRLWEIAQTFAPAIVFSNELIDAFPVHRIVMRAGKLRALCVGLNDRNDFVWVESDLDATLLAYSERVQLKLSEGQITEVNLDADDFIFRAAALLERGFVITVDYGAERNELLHDPYRRQGTLRASYHHQVTGDVLVDPGKRDLTTTIDWTQIKEAGQRAGLQTTRLERLDQFLLNEGLLDELEVMTRAAPNDAEVLRLRTGAREMIMPDGMATSFQVLVQEKVVVRA